MLDVDDRVEAPQGIHPVVVANREVAEGLIDQEPWPYLLRYNKIMMKPEEQLLTKIGEDFLIAVREHGKGLDQAKRYIMPDELVKMGEKYPGAEIVLTLGEKGACYKTRREIFYTPAFKVNAIDTTAAGDTFTGFFIHAILEGKSGTQSLQNAAAASAIAVSRKGASSSIPMREEVKLFLKDHSVRLKN